MSEIFDKTLFMIKVMIFDIEERALNQGIRKDFAVIPYVTEECYEISLEDEGDILRIRIYDDEDDDLQFYTLLILDDGLHPPVYILYDLEEIEEEPTKLYDDLEILMTCYVCGNWIELLAELEVTDLSVFLEKYKDRKVDYRNWDLDDDGEF